MNTILPKAVFLHFLCILTLTLANPAQLDSDYVEDPIVEVSQGLVRGTVENSTQGRLYYSFRGIPYAQPPVGDLRFAAPKEAKDWTDTFNATENSVNCAQALGILIAGVEDCLTLNVYTPSLPDESGSELLPVLVFIYGGGFFIGSTSSDVYGPGRYMNKDVVLVLMNYRLGPFGFFSTGDDAASGNWGLLDQVLALKWVKKNIAAFGGDPTLVTINGESAGSASVMFQVISPAAKGLFRAAIGESGSSLSLWALQRDPQKSSVNYGKLLNCPTNDTQLLVNCLRSKDARTLIKAGIVQGAYNELVLPFLPVVENSGVGKFLTEDPMAILERGEFNKVPIISGTNKDDGDFSYMITRFAYKTIDETFFNETLPTLLFLYTKCKRNLVDVSYAIKAEYYDKIDVTDDLQVARASIDFNTDAVFAAINDQTIHLLAKGGVPVYAYIFGYPGSASKHNFSGEIEISHGDDLPYFFDTPIVLNDDDLKMSDTLVTMWTDFATTLNPTPSGSIIWEQKTTDNNKYLIITEDFVMQDGYRTEQMEFWNIQVPAIMDITTEDVRIKQGLVRGLVAKSTNGRPYYSFRGIPYAEPPIGDLRFKAPVEAQNWTGTFDAIDNSVQCAQSNGGKIVGQEDCLTINVYTPSISGGSGNTLLPVLVFIYGGGFSTGTTSSDRYGPERYMDKDIVLVLMNYRLGPFGFFSTGDDAASGNWGLHDQVLALKWIQENIANFGGDPTKVTINGQSAGSASVMFHVISPASAGLFRGAIAESGSSISMWAVQRNPQKSSVAYGKLLKCPTDDPQLLVDCLRGLDTTSLVEAAIVLGTYNYLVLPFLPVVENAGTGKFLTEYPLTILEQGNFNKVPVISGSNKEDGDLSYGMVQFAYQDIDETFFNKTLPTLLFAYFKCEDCNLIDVSYAIKAEYYDKIDVTNHSQVARASIDFNTDAVFTAINDQTVNLLAKEDVQVYTYVFGYVGSSSHHNYSGEIEVSHGDELSYLFDTGVTLNDKDKAMSDTLLNMWTNFTATLNPTPTETGFIWLPKTTDENNYLIITDDFIMEDGYRTEQMEFWNTEVPQIMGFLNETSTTSTTPTSTTPTSATPTSATPTSATPTSATPTSTTPTSTTQTSTTQTTPTTTTTKGSGNTIRISHLLIIMSMSLFLYIAL